MNPDLADEITSINSIYDESTLTPIPPSAESSTTSTSHLCALRLPSLPSVVLRLDFPANYPDAPPAVLGTQSVGHDVPKGFGTRVVDVVRDVVARVYRAGEPCVFDVVEDVGASLDERQQLAAGEEEENGLNHDLLPEADGEEPEAPTRQQVDAADDDLGPEPPWVMSSALTEKKSVFVARAAAATRPEEARRFVAHLLATDKRVARATHNMTAWRMRGEGGTVYQDCDDDGETAAGGRMLHLMQLMDVWDVVVVVSRWYGGVQLGPDRFRMINQAAREALVAGGFVREEKREGGGKKKGKK